MNSPRCALRTNSPTRRRRDEAEKAHQGRDVEQQEEQHLKGGEVPVESTSDAASTRSLRLRSDRAAAAGGSGGLLELPWESGHSSRRVAVGEQIPDGHLPSRLPQACRQLRDQDRMPAMVGEDVVPSQRGVEHLPADRQDLLGARFHAPLRRRVRSPALRSCSPGRGATRVLLRLRPGVGSSRERSGRRLRSILPDTGLQDELLDQEDSRRDRRRGKLSRQALLVTRAAHSAGAGATTGISPSRTDGAATKATSSSFW